MERATPNIFKPPGLFVHVKRCAEKLRLAILFHFVDSATSALYPGCGAHRGILAFPGPCEIRGDSIHGPQAFRAKWRREGLVRVLFPMGVPSSLFPSAIDWPRALGLQRSSGARANSPGILIPRTPPSPESYLVISFVLCGRRGADRTTHALQKTQALDRWSPRATEAQWYSIDQIWHI